MFPELVPIMVSKPDSELGSTGMVDPDSLELDPLVVGALLLELEVASGSVLEPSGPSLRAKKGFGK